MLYDVKKPVEKKLKNQEKKPISGDKSRDDAESEVSLGRGQGVLGSAIELVAGTCCNQIEEEDEMIEKSGKET